MRKHFAAVTGAILLALGIWYLAGAHSMDQHSTRDGLSVSKGWSIPIPASSANGAAYLMVKNRGAADELLGVESMIAEKIEMHDIVSGNGQVKMQHLPTVKVPEKGHILFQPGGMHIMLMGLKEALAEGREYDVTLKFREAGRIQTVVVVTNESIDLKTAHSGH